MRFQRKSVIWLIIWAGLATSFFLGSAQTHVSAQQPTGYVPTVTGTLSNPYIIVDNTEGKVNVRTGPGTIYEKIGELYQGDQAPALGRSPGGEWIQIAFLLDPSGVGWVYTELIKLSPGYLPIVEPPATITPTFNPTFVAAFQTTPTLTRLPTFTPPPTLVIPTFENPSSTPSGRISMGWVILVLGLIGVLGMFFSFFRNH